jgi:23S rRNA (pseudouridine1915-N3)-methyltransferase
MRLHVVAVGRIRADRQERSLFEDYQLRFNQIARPLALGPLAEIEVEDRKNLGREAEADLLARAVPAGAMIVALDERGRQSTSPEFAALLARWRDGGAQDLAFLIGGADGIAPRLRDRANHSLSFGQMVWPHMLARVMLAEQIYRAATILSGSPYHRT